MSVHTGYPFEKDFDTTCVCCLKRNVILINFLKCRHAKLFGQFFNFKTIYPLKRICRPCHQMFIKIIAFKDQAERSILILNRNISSIPPTNKSKQPVINLSITPIQVHTCGYDPIRVLEINPINNLTYQDEDMLIDDEATANEEAELKPHMDIIANELPGLNHEVILPDEEIKVEQDEYCDADDYSHLAFTAVDKNTQPCTLTSEVYIQENGQEFSTQETTWPQPIQEYEEKVKVIALSKEEYYQEKSQERLKEAYINLPYKCDECAIGFDYEDTLREHMRKRHHKKKGSFVCELCQRVLNSKASFTEHNRRHLRRYECSKCGKRYTTLTPALHHYKEYHDDATHAFTCQLCGFTTDSNRKYRYHRDKHKAKPQCTVCGKAFANNSGLKVHMLSLHNQAKRTYRCKHAGCAKEFAAKSGLYAHELKAHGGGSAAYCVTCRKHFCGPATLRNHLATHSSHVNRTDWKFRCEECGEKFLLKSALREHVDWAHLNKNTYQCEQCSKVFKNARYLQKHKTYVHDKLRPPRDKICDHCGKGFTTLSILRTHIRTHTGERPLPCARCPATFAHPAALYTHNKLLHTRTHTNT